MKLKPMVRAIAGVYGFQRQYLACPWHLEYVRGEFYEYTGRMIIKAMLP